MSKKQRELPWEPWDGEYIGNIWGWKFSFISLGIILFFLFIAIYRFATLEPNNRHTTTHPTEKQQTTLPVSNIDSTAVD